MVGTVAQIPHGNDLSWDIGPEFPWEKLPVGTATQISHWNDSSECSTVYKLQEWKRLSGFLQLMKSEMLPEQLINSFKTTQKLN